MGRMPRTSVPYTAYERELLREAAEFLSRERRLYEERVREELLRREWYFPRPRWEDTTGRVGDR
jgi:hypothetical protein